MKDLWGKLGARLRAALVVVAAIGIVAAIGMALLGGAPKRVLFSGLDPRDAAAVVAALDAAKIPYTLEGGGTVINVPSTDVDRARLMLAEQDLPKTGGVGFEMFAEQSFGLTEFAQKVNYRRALQGELERTIGALDPIASVRVHITQPDKAVFADERVPPTASVTVDLRPGRELADRQVGAIRHLVAAAVEGLSAGEVTVVTTDGALLSRAGADEANGATLDFEVDLERDLEKRLTRLLERTVGIGGVEVTVAAELDFSHTDTTEESYDPEQSAIRSESLQESHEGAGASRPLGVAGAEANQPGGPDASKAGSADDSSRMVRSRNYEINRTVVHTVGPKSATKRLTVAVLVDGTYTPAEDGSDPAFAPRSEAELAEMQTVVENAMGFNSARGDRVKIASVQFRDRQRDDDVAAVEAGLTPTMIGAAAGAALLLAVVLWMVLRKKKTRVSAEVLQLPAKVGDAQLALARAEAGLAGALPPGAEGGTAGALPEAKDAARERALELAAGDPERTADIIRGWLRADQPA
ncbi:MAG: flagellar M-ring protein FliF [Deltaproteobacteria bacterium]|nr:flagellar M-ring protein FliF [Nannocystaceae bacterium]